MGEKANAQAPQDLPPRTTTIIVPFTQYEYWLIRWEDNAIVCRLLIDHNGLPTPEEVRQGCGQELYEVWVNTPPCALIKEGLSRTSDCEGLYLHLASASPQEREVVLELPPPIVWVTLEGCTPRPPDNRCEVLPTLVLTAEEPLPDERILSVQGTIDGVPFFCEGSVCRLPLQPTPLQGVTVEFWANSSFGDTSPTFTAQVRVIDTGVTETPGSGGWYVDVISSQWLGPSIATCARIWEAFPPVGTPPSWLSTPDQSQLLASDEPYFYLAGRLISQGLVDVTGCPGSGLLPNGYADACGLERARPLVVQWQNLFNQRIVEVAEESGIPAQLLKNLFAQESQFWPGVFRVPFEFGLGQITDNGADTILLWNEEFFEQFCPLVLSGDACAEGYLRLPKDAQAILRGALAVSLKVDCAECPYGVDLSEVYVSVSVFAKTMQANCAQVGQIVYNATEEVPGMVSSYEDLWRFTIANYHAGAGCLSYAVHSAWQGSGRLRWEEVATRFTEPCSGVIPYVEKITRDERVVR